MTDKLESLPQSSNIEDRRVSGVPITDSISADEVLKNFDTPAPKEQKPISEEQVRSAIDKYTYGVPKEETKELGPTEQAYYEGRNKLIGASQYTSPYFADYDEKRGLGEAVFDDADNLHYTDKEGKDQKVDADKHVVIYNPKTGKMHAFERSPDTDKSKLYSILTGFGGLVQEGLGSTAPVIRGTAVATAADKALQAQKAVSESTGVTVPISRASIQPGVAAKLTSHIPGVSGVYEQAAERTAEGLGQASAAAAESMGASKTAEQAGETAKGALSVYLAPRKVGGILARKVGDAYDAVDAHVDAAAKSTLDNTAKAVQDINIERMKAGRPDQYGAVAKEVMGAVTNPDGLDYSSMKYLRSVIGEKLSSTASDMEKTELKRVYKALSDDMRSHIEQHGGPRGLQLWERANRMNVAAETRRAQLVKILGVDGNKSDEAVFAALKRFASTNATADARTLAAARKSMSPDEWSEVASGMVYRLGRTGEGAQESFSPEIFLRDYAKMSEAGKNLMFGEGSQLHRALDNIYRISAHWPKMATLGAEPGEAAHIGMLAGAVAESHAEGGLLRGPFKIMGGIFGGRMLAKFLSRPATAANVAKFMQSYKVMALKPTKANLVILNATANQLARDAAEEDRKRIGGAVGDAEDYLSRWSEMNPWKAK